ncbi:adenylyltransferase/cytidyltransferase family protein [Candidatus Parcubacteria bacterium]|nr:adenylyltransferase/cytidyltransferase family protein [Candidatus Parcubacteria bacterium]
MKKFKYGYTAGVYDLFHIGHLNLLKNAKEMCEHLTVGISTDELVKYKHKKSVVCFEERIEIVRHIKHVDAVVEQSDIDKFKMWENLKFNVLFVGDDWKGTEVWNKYEERLKEVDVVVIYLPYTKGTSSTLINQILLKLRGEKEQNYEE